MIKYEELLIGVGLLLISIFIFKVFIKGKKSPVYDETRTDILPSNYIGLWASIVCCIICGLYFVVKFFS
ncbi:Uncharacterised protein [Sphingobacterium spiritivorum]|uniref:Uncharacterized protein n=1 Tax=Sphingobacterium spiritivorum TaxID=258 RepID=A0A380C2D5_SPHSI|nr:Uncharacterised protein [Sphingobacterium spiritivorum]